MSFSGIHVRCYSQVSCAVPCTMLHREEEWGLRSAVCSAIITIMPSAEAATYMVTRCTVNTRYTRYTRYSDHFCCKNIPARCNLHCIFPCPLSSFWRVSAGCEMPVSISLRDVIVRGPRFWHQYFLKTATTVWMLVLRLSSPRSFVVKHLGSEMSFSLMFDI